MPGNGTWERLGCTNKQSWGWSCCLLLLGSPRNHSLPAEASRSHITPWANKASPDLVSITCLKSPPYTPPHYLCSQDTSLLVAPPTFLSTACLRAFATAVPSALDIWWIAPQPASQHLCRQTVLDHWLEQHPLPLAPPWLWLLAHTPCRHGSYAFACCLFLPWSRIHLQCRGPRFDSWARKIRWKRNRLPTPVFLGFPYGSAGKESACNAGHLGSIPGLGRSPREGKGYPLHYSGLQNSMDCIVHGVTKSQTQLSDFHFHFLFNVTLH